MEKKESVQVIAKRDGPFAHLSLPVICAPMFLVSGTELVVEACKGGIVGALPSANARDEFQFADWMDEIASRLYEFSAGGIRPGPIAANLNVRSGLRIATPRFDADIETCRRHRVPLVITVNGDPSPVVQTVHDWGGLVFHDVTTLKHARKAAAAGVDGMVLVCGGGGGHSGLMNPFSFVPQVRKFFDGYIVLAGALATGEAVLAAQVLGADLCYMGTRFIATEESMAPRAYKDMIVRAGSEDLAYTPLFTRGVPAMMLHESLRAAGVEVEHLASIKEPPDEFKAWRDVWAAGQSVGLIEDIPRVAQLIERLQQEFRSAEKNFGALQ
jgi:nitronate monooxygenase